MLQVGLVWPGLERCALYHDEIFLPPGFSISLRADTLSRQEIDPLWAGR
ncbi:uncharacterized protein Dvar_83100 [Desulfosarcina variabilis str. Montpellier]